MKTLTSKSIRTSLTALMVQSYIKSPGNGPASREQMFLLNRGVTWFGLAVNPLVAIVERNPMIILLVFLENRDSGCFCVFEMEPEKAVCALGPLTCDSCSISTLPVSPLSARSSPTGTRRWCHPAPGRKQPNHFQVLLLLFTEPITFPLAGLDRAVHGASIIYGWDHCTTTAPPPPPPHSRLYTHTINTQPIVESKPRQFTCETTSGLLPQHPPPPSSSSSSSSSSYCWKLSLLILEQ